MRSGRGVFDGYEVDSPSNLLSSVIEVLGDFPQSWGTPQFDRDGRPTTDPSKGSPFYRLGQDEQTRSLKAFIADFWDDPGSDGTSEVVIEGKEYLGRRRKRPYPSCFAGKFWKPGAVCRSGVWLGSYNDDSDPIIESLPKIDQEEVDLLYDLISKILRYEPGERPTAKEISSHPWFLIP
jgi:serine/threonine protein kinase